MFFIDRTKVKLPDCLENRENNLVTSDPEESGLDALIPCFLPTFFKFMCLLSFLSLLGT